MVSQKFVRDEYEANECPFKEGVTCVKFWYCEKMPDLPDTVTRVEYYHCKNIPKPTPFVQEVVFWGCDRIPDVSGQLHVEFWYSTLPSR